LLFGISLSTQILNSYKNYSYLTLTNTTILYVKKYFIAPTFCDGLVACYGVRKRTLNYHLWYKQCQNNLQEIPYFSQGGKRQSQKSINLFWGIFTFMGKVCFHSTKQ